MLLRSGRKKPYEVSLHRRQSVKKESLLRNMKSPHAKSAFSLRKTVKCYILTEDSKTVHFDIDEDGHHEISTKDSQSHEDIAWLSVFTKNEPAVTEVIKLDSFGFTQTKQRVKQVTINSIDEESQEYLGCNSCCLMLLVNWMDCSIPLLLSLLHLNSKNLVSLTQRSKLNEFVLLCKGKKHLSLKVLKASCSEPDYPSVESCNPRTCNHEDPDFKQLSEDNNFFIMHYQGDSVQFQCYEDRSYYLHVNDDSLDICKMENKEPNADKNFYFKVSYLQEK